MPELHMEIDSAPSGARLLRLSGPLTIGTLFEFQTEVRRDPATGLGIDLTGVPFMDSAGLGAILGAFVSCQRHGRGFAVIGPPARVVTIFQVARVHVILPLFASLEQAQLALSQPGTA